ncbi:universal stress protein [Amphritea sp.]|uniref:universal stress protein n=1 Tax=Amphritea sp. TaxID=1872502 RepID=UPI003A945EC7
MPVKNILCAYNGSPASEAALKASILMHKKYAAHLTGFFAHGCLSVDTGLRSWMPQALCESVLQVESGFNAKVKQQFLASVEGQVAPDKLHWISEKGRSDATVAEYARLFDVTVVGQFDPLLGREHLELHPDQIALKSGRPVLVFPRGWDQNEIPDHAVLAWDGKRTATRALADAMQILETKKRITVLTVATGKACKPLQGIDVVEALRRHDVEVELVTISPKGRSVGDSILDYCDQVGARLLVTGAYEHSMFREDLVGGVTDTLVRKANIPVLMSH